MPHDPIYCYHPLSMLAQVVQIDLYEEADKPASLPLAQHNYHRDLLSVPFRNPPPKPLDIVQPLGPSFEVSEGHRIKWQKWDFRVGFNVREGFVLHQV